MFQVLPILMGVDASLRRFSLTDEEHPFIGLRNFRRILADSQFLGVVLPNTFFFMFASVAGGVVLGLAIAMLLNRPFPAAPWCGPCSSSRSWWRRWSRRS